MEPENVELYLNRALPPLPLSSPDHSLHISKSSNDSHENVGYVSAYNEIGLETLRPSVYKHSEVEQTRENLSDFTKNTLVSLQKVRPPTPIPHHNREKLKAHRQVAVIDNSYYPSTSHRSLEVLRQPISRSSKRGFEFPEPMPNRHAEGSEYYRSFIPIPMTTKLKASSSLASPRLKDSPGKKNRHDPAQASSLDKSEKSHENEIPIESQRSRSTIRRKSSPPSPNSSTAMSQFHSQPPSDIMGNFIPLEATSKSSGRGIVEKEDTPEMLSFYKEMSKKNPFTTESSMSHPSSAHMTSFGDFVGSEVQLSKGLRQTHTKNSLSESNARLTTARPTRPTRLPTISSSQRFSKSESSPAMSPSKTSISSARQIQTPSRVQHDEQHRLNTRARSKSTAAITQQPRTHTAFAEPSRRGRNRSKSPAKQLFEEQPELEGLSKELTHDPPQRSRSPMKRIFGEGGWLGPSADAKAASTSHSKKPSVMIKIKNKIEEIGQKSDISPVKKTSSKSDTDSSRRTSDLPISLSPSQQAKLTSDLELILCSTANAYLMEQYVEGRISVESLKKVTDFWSSKGRPQVLEFQYDQATQRDLIIANVKNFDFHGLKGDNPHFIEAMLYNWKDQARTMAVRTFCYPDSVILKQLHDTELFLELLGASHESFAGLCKLQVHFNEIVSRVEKEKKRRESKEKDGPKAPSSRSHDSSSSSAWGARDAKHSFDRIRGGMCAPFHEFSDDDQADPYF